jgi:hypothetical protein
MERMIGRALQGAKGTRDPITMEYRDEKNNRSVTNKTEE